MRSWHPGDGCGRAPRRGRGGQPAAGATAALIDQGRDADLWSRRTRGPTLLGSARRHERQSILRVLLNLRSAERQRKVFALSPVRRQVLIVRAERLRRVVRARSMPVELSHSFTSITNMNDAPEVCFVLVSVALEAAWTVKPSPPRRTGST